MKKITAIVLSVSLAVLAGCAASSTAPSSFAPGAPAANAPAFRTPGFDPSREIAVVSREDGSGTRGAFIELTGVQGKDAAGSKVDNTTDEAMIANSTSAVMTTVAQNPYAIGYISLGSLNDTVKALAVGGVAATADNVKNGSYKISRPFNIVKSQKAGEPADDFIKYIMSAQGQALVEKNGCISESNQGSYSTAGLSGKIVVAGSSSVTPVMEKLKEAYMALNPKIEIELQTSDSTTGMNAAIDGICDIGMASRELKDSELEKGLKPLVIALDGIAMIVNKENTANSVAIEQIKAVFTGETTKWNAILG